MTAAAAPARVLCVSVTEQGAALAARLPYEHHHGDLVAAVASRWGEVDGLVLCCATGIAVRAIGPLLADKATDPGVVCVDDAGRWAVALAGGHGGGANDLAREVAALLGAEAVISTATDAAAIPGLDDLPGVAARGDVAVVTAALLRGHPVTLVDEVGWPLPRPLADRLTRRFGADSARTGEGEPPTGDDGPVPLVRVTDRAVTPAPGEVVLHPPTLVAGIGASKGAPADEVAALLAGALADARLARDSVAEVATADLKAAEPGILALGLPMRTYPVDQLAGVAVPNPSAAVADAVGTGSVAEAAALVAAGPGAELLVPKRRSSTATAAIARRRHPRGRLLLVGLGPGDPAHRTPAAAIAVRRADVVIGYRPYVDQAADLLSARQEVIRRPIGAERDRAVEAVQRAGAGQVVALVCSGDAGVYAMASIALEVVASDPTVLAFDDVEVVPGVTAAVAASALLGAPLGHDHVAISLSDLLTPWPVIERRIQAAAAADLVVAFYNPRSRGRDWQLDRARDLLAHHRAPGTPVGVVTDAGRPGEAVTITTLGELDAEIVGMTSCVVVGSSTTYAAGGRLVTPRGYPG